MNSINISRSIIIGMLQNPESINRFTVHSVMPVMRGGFMCACVRARARFALLLLLRVQLFLEQRD